MAIPHPANGHAPERSGSFWCWLLALLGGLFVSATQIKSFGAWDQVTALWEAGLSPILLLGHPHFLRFLASYPGFLMEDRWPDIGFSSYISFFLAFNVVLWRKVSFLAQGRGPLVRAWLLFFVFHFFMNGRGVIAWTGWLLCVWLCLRMSRGGAPGIQHVLLVAISCWLAAVSTGVFIVVAVALILFHLPFLRKLRWSFSGIVVALGLGGPLLFNMLEYFWIALDKNITFYGGGWEGAKNVLNHGLGTVFLASDFMLALLFFAGGCVVMAAFVMFLSGRKIASLPKLLLIAVVGGLFGFTVLTLAIPLALLQFSPRPKALPGG